MNNEIRTARKMAILPTSRIIGLGALGWISMLGIDFFLHAGLLAKLYAQPSPFLLPPEDAFRLIPIGYLSFLLLDVLILWLIIRLQIAGWQRGLSFGLIIGGLIWGAMTLGLLSISTASPGLMLGWFAGQVVELGVAGAVIGSGLAGTPLRKILVRVIVLILALVVATFIMQNIGLAPAVTISA
jgi:hypothetical protein